MGIYHYFLRVLVISLCMGVAGCAKKVTPRLPEKTVLAAFSDGSAMAQSQVPKAFELAFADQYKILKEHFARQKNALTNQLDRDFLQDYFGVEPQHVKWSLLTMGELTRRAKGSKLLVPHVAIVVNATLDKEAVMQHLTQRLSQKEDAGKLEASTLDGQPIWLLKHKDLGLADGFAPCLTFIGKDVLVMASHEDALKEQLDLYAGKTSGIGADSVFNQVLTLQKGVVSRVMVGDIQSLLQKLMTDEERKSALETPYVSTLMKTVRWTTFDLTLVEQPQAIDLAWRIGCADESGAQAVNEVLITLRTSTKMGLSFLIKSKPDLQPVMAWLDRIKLGATAQEASLVIHVTPDDAKNLDLAKLLER